MNEFQQAWLWFGKEAAEFGLRWAFLGLIVLGFGGWFGKRYHDMRRDIAEMKKANRPSQQSVTVHFHGNIGTVNLGADGFYRAQVDGKGEIVSPVPIELRPKPLTIGLTADKPKLDVS